MSLFRRVERELDERLRKLFAGNGDQSAQGPELIEIYRGVLDEVASRVQPLPRGKRGFPYNHVLVQVAVPDAEQLPLYQSAFIDGDPLRADILEAVRQQGAEPPSDFAVEVDLADTAIPSGFRVLCQRREAAATSSAAASVAPVKTSLQLRVIRGKAEQDTYSLSSARVNVGRLADILDDHERLIRRNDIVFLEGEDGANSTVSRSHAHIERDAETGEYRLFDDRSAYGTSLFRDGRLIPVPSGAARGLALRAGDEIYFGQVRMKVDTLPA